MRGNLSFIENEQMNVVEVQNGLIQIYHKGLGVVWEVDRNADGVIELRTYKDGLLREAILFSEHPKKIEAKYTDVDDYWAAKHQKSSGVKKATPRSTNL